MTELDVFNIIVGVLGIVSFIFSVWIWMRSDMKIRELMGAIDTILEISESALWEWQYEVESAERKLQRAEKVIGFVSSIQKMANNYSSRTKKNRQAEGPLAQLIDRGIIHTGLKYDDLEMLDEYPEIWLVTPDFKPDSSNRNVGVLVNKNIKSGKKYVFFYPEDMPRVQNEILALQKNIGVLEVNSKLRRNVKLIPLKRQMYPEFFNSGGNISLYFRDTHRSFTPLCFEEIVFSQAPERGGFWQEHTEEKTKQIWHKLELELAENFSTSS